jgi:hypothetical protein
MSIKVMLKYDVFDDYGKTGSQCRSTGMTRRGHLDNKKRVLMSGGKVLG